MTWIAAPAAWVKASADQVPAQHCAHLDGTVYTVKVTR